jgi:hypothetical protein
VFRVAAWAVLTVLLAFISAHPTMHPRTRHHGRNALLQRVFSLDPADACDAPQQAVAHVAAGFPCPVTLAAEPRRVGARALADGHDPVPVRRLKLPPPNNDTPVSV